MTRAAMLLLTIGTALFVALLAWQGFGSIAATMAVAGWGLALVAAFHLVPLVLDAAAIQVLFDRRDGTTGRVALLARWAGESVNSLLPAGQIGGPVLMVRHLAQHGVPAVDAASAITVSTTMQLAAQIVFALLGLALLFASASREALAGWSGPIVVATVLLAVFAFSFYRAQRRGLFSGLVRMVARAFVRKDDWSGLAGRADAIDAAVRATYRRHGRVAATFGWSLVAWIVGTGEVWLALRFLGHPVGWLDALLLESIGQAIRGAAFAIPGSIGVQEGGYVLLAPLVGLPPDAGLALSLAKRAREIAFGLPGLVYLQWSERRWHRHRPASLPVAD